jgi:hypothetical protein
MCETVRNNSGRRGSGTILSKKVKNIPIDQQIPDDCLIDRSLGNYSGRLYCLGQEGTTVEGVAEVFQDGEAVFAQG